MYCVNCGKKIPDGFAFCPNCGAKVVGPDDEKTSAKGDSGTGNASSGTVLPDSGVRETSAKAAPQPARTEKKEAAAKSGGLRAIGTLEDKPKKKGKGFLIVLILAALAGTGAYLYYYQPAVLSGLLHRSGVMSGLSGSVDLSSYVNISFIGANGQGTASYQIDEDALLSADSSLSRQTLDADGLLLDGSGLLELTPASGLSNGDTVSYHWNDEMLSQLSDVTGVQFTGTSGTVTVDGLMDASTVDLFKYISVRFTGVNGSGTAVVDGKGLPEAYRGYTPVASPAEGLSNDDVITVSFSDEDVQAMAAATGTIPLETSRQYTVSGLSDTEQTEEAPAAGGPIGEISVRVNRLNIRQEPSKTSKSLGHVQNGVSYPVYEITSAGGYTWYRIGDGQWVADDGSWVNYTSY